MRGTVYTETTVHSAPANLADQAPYQIAIVELADGTRRTVRIEGDRVQIGDAVELSLERDGVLWFAKAEVASASAVQY